MYGRADAGEPPGEEGAAVNGVFEPGILVGGDVAVEVNFDHALLLTGELADLDGPGAGGGLPIDVAGAFEGFVGADAVKVAAETTVVGFDFAGDAGEEIVEAGLGSMEG